MSIKNFQMCDRVSIVALSLTVFLGMAAFIPGGFLPSSILKGYLVVASSLVAFVAWLLGRLIEGSFRIPWTPMLAATGIFVLALFLSALFSKTPYLSFFGEGFDQGTFAVLGSLLLSLFVFCMLFTSRSRILAFLKGFFIVYIVIAVFQLVHVLFPTFTTLGVFYNRVDSPVGVWSDFAFLSGAALIGFTLVLQFMKPPKRMRILAIVGSLLALFFVILANILMVWILVGFSFIVILIHSLITNRFSEERRFPFLAFGLSLVALLFVLANSLFGGFLASKLNASYVDVHPSISASLHVSALSLREHPVFGVGPNRFLGEWLTKRPVAVNNHALWDVPFSAGSSAYMTIAVLAGALGILAALFFLAAYGYESLRKVFLPTVENPSGAPVLALFLLSLYFLLALVFFSPGITVTICAFAFIGIFFGSLVGEKRIPERGLYFLKDPRASFFSILCIVALLMISAGVAYAATERFGAIVLFEKGLADARAGDLVKADGRLTQAISLADLPLFERTRVLLAEQSVQNTLSAATSTTSSDAVRSSLQSAISVGNTAARQAIALDPADPANYLSLGDLLRLITPLKVDGVVAAAEDAYNHAITLAPNYPKTYLSLAELYFDSGDNKKAREFAQKAIDVKPNYTEAFFLMSQIETADGNSDAAVKRLQDATVIDPNNPDTYFELGLLRYNNGSYSDAAAAFRTAVNLNAQYLNAWFYLALADQKIGAISEANDILNALHAQMPNNQSIKDALNGVSTAPTKPAIAPATLPATTGKQEKAKKLPVPTDTPAPTGSKTTNP